MQRARFVGVKLAAARRLGLLSMAGCAEEPSMADL
jgi:hypothetical protein